MTKLPKNILQNIEISKIKTLFQENKDVFDFKEYIRDYIKSILQEENKGELEKEDFETLEGFIEVKEDYARILRKIRSAFSYELLNILSKGQTLEEFESFINNDNIENIIKYGELENIKLFFSEDFYDVKNKEDLEEIFKNPNIDEIIDLIELGEIENIKLFFSEDFYDVKNRKDLEEIFKNPNVDEIINLIEHGEIENIKFFFGKKGIIKNRKDLEEIFKNPNVDEIIDLIKTGKIENIKFFFGENFYNIKNIGNLEELFNFNFNVYPYLFIPLNKEQLKIFYNCFKNGFSKENIGDAYELLFPVESSGSKVFDEIKEKMSKNKNKNKDMYEILRETTNNFLDKQKSSKQESGELELAIYLRYSHTVNYPEIGELIIIFLQEIIKRNGIKGVKGIKILPREKYILPRGNIGDENTRFCNISGKDFIKEFNTNSIPFYLSHSRNQSNGLAVVSGNTERKKGQIDLGLELEEQYDRLDTDKKSINNILTKLVKIILKINKII